MSVPHVEAHMPSNTAGLSALRYSIRFQEVLAIGAAFDFGLRAGRRAAFATPRHPSASATTSLVPEPSHFNGSKPRASRLSRTRKGWEAFLPRS